MVFFAISTYIKQQLDQVIKIHLDSPQLSANNFTGKIEFNHGKNIISYKTFIHSELTQINELDYLTFNQSNQDIIIKVSGNSWLEFEIKNQYISQWLCGLNLIKIPQLSTLKINNQNLPFNLYYTHARYCSILKSAHQQKIIQLNNLEFQQYNWYLENYHAINYQLLMIPSSYEYQLIRELVIITELIYQNNPKINYVNVLKILSKKMLNMERYCRIWGETKNNNLSLSQARLGLMAIALRYYQHLFYAQFEQELPNKL